MSGARTASSPPLTSPVSGYQRVILRRVWSALWRHLPMLALSAAVTAIPAALGFWAAGGHPLLLPVLLALLAGPTLMALLSVVQGALVEDDTELRSYLRQLRGTGLRSMLLALIPAGSSVSLFAAAEAYAHTGHPAFLLSLCTAVTATILAVAGFVVVLPLVVARPQLRGLRLWVTGWHLLGRWPVRFLAPIVLAGLALWVAMALSSTLVLLLPAPIALLAGAAYWCCAVELGAEDVIPPGEASEGTARRLPSSLTSGPRS